LNHPFDLAPLLAISLNRLYAARSARMLRQGYGCMPLADRQNFSRVFLIGWSVEIIT
jgi:hypothetical protein